MAGLLSFPDPVNEVSARLVAAGVALLCTAILVLGSPLLLVALAYGFVARVLTGPTLSPLGQLVTRIVTPLVPVPPRPVPGPPKRFAQGIGATLSVSAVVLHFGVGAPGAALVLVAMILVAATLEAVLGLCLGCTLYRALVRGGLIPATACVECSDIKASAPPPVHARR